MDTFVGVAQLKLRRLDGAKFSSFKRKTPTDNLVRKAPGAKDYSSTGFSEIKQTLDNGCWDFYLEIIYE